VEEVHPEGQLKIPTHGDPILPMSKQLESTRYFVFVGLAYQGKNIVLKGFWPLGNIIGLFLYEDF